MGPNTHRGLFSGEKSPLCVFGTITRHFVCTYMHNPKTKGCIRVFYLTNNRSTVRDIYLLGQRCMRDTISELWIQTCITGSFQCVILCILTLTTRKLQVTHVDVLLYIYMKNNCSTTCVYDKSIFYVRAGFKIRLVSYGSKHASHSLSNKLFVHTWTHNLKTTGHIWTFCI